MAKFAHDDVVPFKESELAKKDQVADMFNNIAYRYDFLNRFLSVGIDVGWRKTAIKELKSIAPKKILDVATGTADVALLTEQLLKPTEIVGIDISDGMLGFGREKIKAKGLENTITLLNGDSENIRFNNDYFDAITVAFGVRNFENLEKGLAELRRVVKENSSVYILEFSKVEGFLAPFYMFYFKNILPQIGKLVSKDNRAYTYLPDSVNAFPFGEKMKQILLDTGYSKVEYKKLSLGIATIYKATK